MEKKFISNSTESKKMFKSSFLEALSKVHFTVPLIVYVPVVLFFGWRALFIEQMNPANFVLTFIMGLLFWSLTEYFLHRVIFHFEPKSNFGKKIHFIFHGVHHDYPNDAKRLVMPPSVSIPLATGFYFLFSVFLATKFLYSFFAAFITGYLIYDMTHYALHHSKLKGRYMKKLKKHHMLHHYTDDTKGFGVSSSLWDKIFGSNF